MNPPKANLGSPLLGSRRVLYVPPQHAPVSNKPQRLALNACSRQARSIGSSKLKARPAAKD
jgi:hypothetical protein